MSKSGLHAAWFVVLALLAGEARAQGPSPVPPPPEPAPAATPAPAPATPPPAAVTPPPAAKPMPFGKRPFLEMTTLRMLKEKGLITQEDYDHSTTEFMNWLGVKGEDSATFVLGTWKTTVYGFVEPDAMYHTTQSFTDLIGNAQVQKGDTYAGQNGRFTFSVRNSRLGLRLAAPDLKNLKASGVFEFDLFGPGALNPGSGFASQNAATNATTPNYNAEQPFFTNPVLRVRHAYLKLETPVLDFVFGQTWNLVGGQPTFIPAILQLPGTVGGLFGRTEQLRVGHTFKSSAVDFDIQVAMLRGAQRDSGLPEGQAGLKLSINGWKGLHSAFLAGTGLLPLTINVSGAIRPIAVPVYSTANGTGVPAKQQVNGWAVAADVYIPLYPAKNRQSASLSILGEFTQGEGINDLYTGLTGGVGALRTKNGAYANLDPGLAIYDKAGAPTGDGKLTLIGWRTYIANLEFFVPKTSGRFCIFGSYGHSEMTNAQQLFGKASGQPNNGIRDHEDMFDAGAFVDVYPGFIRLAADWQLLQDYYVQTDTKTTDTTIKAENHAVQLSGFLFF